jgi:hypothetical protein
MKQIPGRRGRLASFAPGPGGTQWAASRLIAPPVSMNQREKYSSNEPLKRRILCENSGAHVIYFIFCKFFGTIKTPK